jgi:serine/threonine protein kinase
MSAAMRTYVEHPNTPILDGFQDLTQPQYGRCLAWLRPAARRRRIIHRDLKPENIYLIPDPEVAAGERTKILDFGIAKLSDDHPDKLSTSTGMLMGTPAYMSPEQCRGLKELDHRSDIYALGCVLFRMLTGQPPFDGEGPGDIISAHIREPAPSPSRYIPDLSASVDALVLRCLAKAPAARYRTMAELAIAIGQLLQQMPGDGVPRAGSPLPLPPMPVNPPRGLAQVTTLGRSSGQFAATDEAEQISRRRSGSNRWIAGIVASVRNRELPRYGWRICSSSHPTGRLYPRMARLRLLQLGGLRPPIWLRRNGDDAGGASGARKLGTPAVPRALADLNI